MKMIVLESNSLSQEEQQRGTLERKEELQDYKRGARLA
jgi:hypothetical protein